MRRQRGVDSLRSPNERNGDAKILRGGHRPRHIRRFSVISPCAIHRHRYPHRDITLLLLLLIPRNAETAEIAETDRWKRITACISLSMIVTRGIPILYLHSVFSASSAISAFRFLSIGSGFVGPWQQRRRAGRPLSVRRGRCGRRDQVRPSRTGGSSNGAARRGAAPPPPPDRRR